MYFVLLTIFLAVCLLGPAFMALALFLLYIAEQLYPAKYFNEDFDKPKISQSNWNQLLSHTPEKKKPLNNYCRKGCCRYDD
jgi:hypothetical protein